MQTVDRTTTATSDTAAPDPARRRQRRLGIAAATVGAACLAGAGVVALVAGDDDVGTQQVDVTADDTRMALDTESVRPGFTEFAVTNDSDSEHSLAVVRLGDGMTLDDMPDLLNDPDFAAVEEAVEFFGGVNRVLPGDTFTMTIELVPGDYALVDFGEGPEGPWFLHDGFIRGLEVTDGDPVGEAPDADVEIAELDFAFDIPATVPRDSVWRVTNPSDSNHEFDLLRLDEGVTADEAIEQLLEGGDEGDAPGEEVNILGGLSAGRTAYVDVSLEPGDYVAVCFWPNAEHDGAPHVVDGMWAPFTVE